MAAALAACLALAGGSVAAGQVPDAESVADAVAGGDSIVDPGDPVFRAGREEALEALREAREERADAQARAERRVSRRAFKGLRREEVLSLAERKFPDLIGRADGRPLRLPNGLQIAAPVSEIAVRLETALGKGAGVAVSTHPVAVDAGGRLEPVDLDLVADGGVLRSRLPAVDVEYPLTADGPVRVGESGVSFEAVGAQPAGSVTDANELFYPDALAGDTDFALVPKPEGVEAFWQLRSEDSPEQLALEFTLPAGARLELIATPPGAARIVAADGSLLANVLAPAAVDADGTAVPVEASVEGGILTLGVAHRDQDLAYPILVDPTVAEHWRHSTPGDPGSFVNCGDGTNAGKWTYVASLPNGSAAFLPFCDATSLGWGHGLYVGQWANFWVQRCVDEPVVLACAA